MSSFTAVKVVVLTLPCCRCPALTATPPKAGSSRGDNALLRCGANAPLHIDNNARKPLFVITSATSHRPLSVGDVVSIDLTPR